MSFDILGIPINPDLSDYLAVMALGFAGYTYLVGSRRWSRSKKSEEIKTARELMDRVMAKNERRYQTPPDVVMYDGTPGRHELWMLDIFTDILEEIEYYGFLVKNDVIKEFELLQHDRVKVYEIWRELVNKGRDTYDYLESYLDESFKSRHFVERKIKKFNDLIDTTRKYWEPDKKGVTSSRVTKS
jgi:hypothetical protein